MERPLNLITRPQFVNSPGVWFINTLHGAFKQPLFCYTSSSCTVNIISTGPYNQFRFEKHKLPSINAVVASRSRVLDVRALTIANAEQPLCTEGCQLRARSYGHEKPASPKVSHTEGFLHTNRPTAREREHWFLQHLICNSQTRSH